MIGLIVFVVIIWLLIGLASVFILHICSDRGPAYTAEGRFLRKLKRQLEQFGYLIRTVFLFPLTFVIGIVGLAVVVGLIFGAIHLICYLLTGSSFGGDYTGPGAF